MDKDTFLVVETRPATDDFFSKNCIVVDGGTEPTSSLGPTLSSPTSRSIAIVDRTSAVSEAARDIVRSRFAFCGRSPYAPDLVLVNEFVLDKFCTAAAKYGTELFGSNLSSIKNKNLALNGSASLQKDLEASGARSFISGSNQCIAIVDER